MCIFVAVFAAIFAVSEYLRRRRLLGEATSSKVGNKSALQNIAFALGRVFEGIGELPFISSINARAENRLQKAGIDSKEIAAGFVALEIILILLGAAMALALFNNHPFVAATVGGASLCLFLELWLFFKIRTRRESIQRDLPFALDMLTLCVEAGLDLAQAITKVSVRLMRGPLAQELHKVDRSLRSGASRGEALLKMTGPTSDPALASLASLLIRADRMGSGVGPILRSASIRLRRTRFLQAERRGATAAQKALVPLIICIMPATFVIVFGPIAVRLITGGLEALL
ncbi:MAG: type II secretion system F family protein [Pseudomonadota bacterium]